jgi:uncharacterized integral membrane protein
MKKLKLILIIIFTIAVAMLILQNTARVQANYLWFTAEIPVIVLLFFTAAGGFVLGLFVAFFKKGSAKPRS